MAAAARAGEAWMCVISAGAGGVDVVVGGKSSTWDFLKLNPEINFIVQIFFISLKISFTSAHVFTPNW